MSEAPSEAPTDAERLRKAIEYAHYPRSGGGYWACTIKDGLHDESAGEHICRAIVEEFGGEHMISPARILTAILDVADGKTLAPDASDEPSTKRSET